MNYSIRIFVSKRQDPASGPDPDQVERLFRSRPGQAVLRIRIRTGSAFILVGLIRIRIRIGNTDPDLGGPKRPAKVKKIQVLTR